MITIPRDSYETKGNTMAAAGQLPDSTQLSEAMTIEFAANDLLADVSLMYPSDAAPLKSLTFTYKGKPVGYSSGNEVLLLILQQEALRRRQAPLSSRLGRQGLDLEGIRRRSQKAHEGQERQDPERSYLMGNIEIYQYPPGLFPKVLRFENYPAALSIFPFGRYLINTLTITIPSVLGILMTSTMAAYALARIEFPFIASMLMPGTVTIIPIFKTWVALGIPSGYIPLIVAAFLEGGAFNIFLSRQFFMGIPRDLDEAARIDGAGHFTILTRILLPLIKPVLISIGLFAFILYWNDVLGPLIYISRNEQNTISQGLANFRGGYGTDYKAIMAASCMSVAPAVTLYFIGQKYFIEGIVLSGRKS